MEHILDEIRATLDSGIYYPALSATLMIPDACGAIEYWGQAKLPRYRYVEWYDRWVLPFFFSEGVIFDGSIVYLVRNAMIHESTGFTRGKHGFDRVMFMPPNDMIVADRTLLKNVGGTSDTIFVVTISSMLTAMEYGVLAWLKDVRDDVDKRRESAMDKIIQYRPKGHLPYFDGIPIVS